MTFTSLGLPARDMNDAQQASLRALLEGVVASYPPAADLGLHHWNPGVARNVQAVMVESPILRRVVDGSERLGDFWQRIAAEGAPLIEALPAEPATRLVTFVFRGDSQTRSIAVVGGPAGFDIPNQQMQPWNGSDLWFRSYRVPRETRTVYELSENGPLLAPWQTRDLAPLVATFRADPLNPRRCRIVESVGPCITRSLLELPDAPPMPHGAAHPDCPRGSLQEHHIESAALGTRRPLSFYLPDPSHGAPQGLMIVFDGVAFTRTVPTPRILDSLIASGRIPPTAAVFVDSLGVRRNLELPCHGPFAAFVAGELLPWVHARCGKVARERTVLAGASYGGAAASYIAQAHPSAFGNVLSLSGSYWVKGDAPGDRDWGWLPRRFESGPTLSLRVYQCIGLFEQGSRLFDDAPEQLAINRRMRDVLRAKGYELTYREYAGGHDYAGWEPCMAEGLEALLGG
jgi:enterochelin esterase family protein